MLNRLPRGLSIIYFQMDSRRLTFVTIASGGERQFNGLVDVYKKTLASDGIAGLYRGFVPSVVGIIVYRGLYFGVYDSLSTFTLLNQNRILTRLSP